MSVGLVLPNPWWGSGVCSWRCSLTHTHKTGLTEAHTLLNPFPWSQYLTFTLLDFYNRAYIVWIGQRRCACYVVIDAMVASGSQTVINRSLLTAIINKYTLLYSHWLPLVWVCIYIQEQVCGHIVSPLIFCVCLLCVCMYVSVWVCAITSLCHSEGGQPCPYISGNAS